MSQKPRPVERLFADVRKELLTSRRGTVYTVPITVDSNTLDFMEVMELILIFPHRNLIGRSYIEDFIKKHKKKVVLSKNRQAYQFSFTQPAGTEAAQKQCFVFTAPCELQQDNSLAKLLVLYAKADPTFSNHMTPLHSLMAAKLAILNFRIPDKQFMRYIKCTPDDVLREKDSCNNSLGHLLAANGYTESLKELHSRVPNLLRENNNKSRSVVDVAVIEDQIETLLYLMEVDHTLLTCQGSIHRAAGLGHVNMLRLVHFEAVKKEITSPLAATYSSETLLMRAAKYDQVDVINFLVETFGADELKKTDNGGKIAVHIAAENNKSSALKVMLEINPALAAVAADKGLLAIHFAASAGSFKCISCLRKCPTEKGLEPLYIEDSRSWFPLGILAARGHFGVLKSLADSPGVGQEFYKKRDSVGRNIAHYAAIKANLACLKNIHKKNSGLLQQISKAGSCAALFAARNFAGSNTLLWILGQQPEQLIKPGKEKVTALHELCKYSVYKSALLEILKYNSVVLSTLTTVFGHTPAHFAARYGNLEILKILLNKEPGLLYQTNSAGKTPLQLIEEYRNETEANKLKEQFPKSIAAPQLGGSGGSGSSQASSRAAAAAAAATRALARLSSATRSTGGGLLGKRKSDEDAGNEKRPRSSNNR